MLSLHHFPRFRLSNLIQIVFLLSAFTATLANPVSSPEINNLKSSKSIASTVVNNANSLQQQQQQKPSQQDPHLNSLTVYAHNFDSITSSNPQLPSSNFRPSYSYHSNSISNNNYNSNSNGNTNNNFNSNSNSNSDSNSVNDNNSNGLNVNSQNHNNFLTVPEIETNFTPMQPQSTSIQTSELSQPVIMQYMPQTVQTADGFQYLQLIPTRPLIVPISSYLAGTSAGQVAADVGTTLQNNIAYHQQQHQHSPSLSAANALTEYVTRTPPILNPQLTQNVAVPSPSLLMDIPATHTHTYGGVQAYAPQILHPYRNLRINREIKPKNLPPGLSLNMHEYMPSPHDPPRAQFIRGRP